MAWRILLQLATSSTAVKTVIHRVLNPRSMIYTTPYDVASIVGGLYGGSIFGFVVVGLKCETDTCVVELTLVTGVQHQAVQGVRVLQRR